MCRLLAVRSPAPVPITPYLEQFARLAQASQTYQGHGWGIAYRNTASQWVHYKNIQPIWDADVQQFPASALFLVHARSAYRDEGIVVENNMPFYDEDAVFIFNGELQGVRLKAEGRIGAEKIFCVIKRFYRGDMGAALRQGTALIRQRTRAIRAMNIIMADTQRLYVSSFYTGDPAYFQMAVKRAEATVVCSAPLPGENDWQRLPNDSFHIF
jgi:predicted glutamine amidotransferase